MIWSCSRKHVTLKQLTKLSVTNARSDFGKTREGEAGRGCQIGEREAEKIVIFFGRPLSSEVKLWRQHHGILDWRRSQRKDAFMNYHVEQESINRQYKIVRKIALVSAREDCRGRARRKSNQFSFLRSFLLDTLRPRPGVFRYINTKYDTPPRRRPKTWPNKKENCLMNYWLSYCSITGSKEPLLQPGKSIVSFIDIAAGCNSVLVKNMTRSKEFSSQCSQLKPDTGVNILSLSYPPSPSQHSLFSRSLKIKAISDDNGCKKSFPLFLF